MSQGQTPVLLILNQMAGPMTWELAEDLGKMLGTVALLTGHPDTLTKGNSNRVLLRPAHSYQRGSYFRRVLSWLLYTVQAFFWLWSWPNNLPLLVFSNPPFLCWLGLGMKKLRGLRYLVMVHDIYPDILINVGGFSARHPIIRLWYWLNRLSYENADAVMTLGECMATNLEKQFDSQKTKLGKVQVICPWVDTSKIKPMPKERNWFAQKYGQVGKLTVMYAGNMGLGHDIETIVKAAEQLQNDAQIHFVFVGAGPKWELVKAALSDGVLNNVTLLPWQSEESLSYVLATAEIGIVSLDNGMNGLAVPSKAFYMMAAGAALIGLSNYPSDVQIMINSYRCGTSVEPGDIDTLVRVITEYSENRTILAQQRFAARIAAERVFSRSINVQCIHDIIVQKSQVEPL